MASRPWKALSGELFGQSPCHSKGDHGNTTTVLRMKFITLDAETYYDKVYSLRKMTPAEYILDERFELICMAVSVDFGEPFFIDGPDFPAWLAQYDPKDVIMLTYNALFDQCILAWRYDFVPARMIDGLGMARALLGHKLPRLGLEAVAQYLGAGQKGDTVHTVIGMRRADIMAQPDLWASYQAYNLNDVRLLNNIFKILSPQFPKQEFAVMDLVLRCAVEPVFEADLDLLHEHLNTVIHDKEVLIAATGADKAALMSTSEFTKLLEAQGVVIGTLEESRTRRLIAIARLPWPNGMIHDKEVLIAATGADKARA